MRCAHGLCAAVLVVGLVAGPVLAGDWTLQRLPGGEFGPASGEVAIGFRDGVWPTVFSVRSTKVVAFNMRPVGWVPMELPGGTHGATLLSQPAEAADGRVGVVVQGPDALTLAEVSNAGMTVRAVGTSGKLQPSAAHTTDLAYGNHGATYVSYTSNGSPWLATDSAGGTWSNQLIDLSPCPPSNVLATSVDVDSYGHVGVGVLSADSDLRFAEKGPLVPEWRNINLDSATWGYPSMSVQYGTSDIPGALMFAKTGPVYSTFDPRLGDWGPWESIPGLLYPRYPLRIDLVFDSLGRPATVFVDTKSLFFAIRGDDGWSVESLSLPSSGPTPTDVSIAFDQNDRPAVAFRLGSEVYVAYGGVPNPEPATAALLAAAGVLASLRRRARR